MKFDETEKNTIAYFFNCLFGKLVDLFSIEGGLTKGFVSNTLSDQKKEIIGIAGFCSPTHDKNLIIVSFADGGRLSYLIGAQAIMHKIPLFLPPETPLEATIHSIAS